MSKTLRVANIGFSTTVDQLKDAFSQYGTVRAAKLAESHLSGKSRGFGFVQMSSESEAEACVTSLNGREHDGREWLVTVAPELKIAKRKAR